MASCSKSRCCLLKARRRNRRKRSWRTNSIPTRQDWISLRVSSIKIEIPLLRRFCRHKRHTPSEITPQTSIEIPIPISFTSHRTMYSFNVSKFPMTNDRLFYFHPNRIIRCCSKPPRIDQMNESINTSME